MQSRTRIFFLSSAVSLLCVVNLHAEVQTTATPLEIPVSVIQAKDSFNRYVWLGVLCGGATIGLAVGSFIYANSPYLEIGIAAGQILIVGSALSAYLSYRCFKRAHKELKHIQECPIE